MRTPILTAAIVLLSAAVAPAAGLIDAARANDTASVRTLLAEHADANATQPDGATALHRYTAEYAGELVLQPTAPDTPLRFSLPLPDGAEEASQGLER